MWLNENHLNHERLGVGSAWWLDIPPHSKSEQDQTSKLSHQGWFEYCPSTSSMPQFHLLPKDKVFRGNLRPRFPLEILACVPIVERLTIL